MKKNQYLSTSSSQNVYLNTFSFYFYNIKLLLSIAVIVMIQSTDLKEEKTAFLGQQK